MRNDLCPAADVRANSTWTYSIPSTPSWMFSCGGRQAAASVHGNGGLIQAVRRNSRRGSAFPAQRSQKNHGIQLVYQVARSAEQKNQSVLPLPDFSIADRRGPPVRAPAQDFEILLKTSSCFSRPRMAPPAPVSDPAAAEMDLGFEKGSHPPAPMRLRKCGKSRARLRLLRHMNQVSVQSAANERFDPNCRQKKSKRCAIESALEKIGNSSFKVGYRQPARIVPAAARTGVIFEARLIPAPVENQPAGAGGRKSSSAKRGSGGFLF